MPLSQHTVLVLEDEYLIALEIGRILEEAHIGSAEIVRSLEDLGDGPAALARFDAAIVEIRTPGQTAHPAAERLRAQGIPVVFGTVFDEYRDGMPGFPGAPVVMKPYATDLMVAAVLGAIAGRACGSGKPPA